MKKIFIAVLSAAMVAVTMISCAGVDKSNCQAAAEPVKKLRVGLLVDNGCNGNGLFHLASLIAHSPQAELVTLMGSDIRNGKLKEIDVLVLPGGGAARQYHAIGAEHAGKVRDFIRQGGGYVGTCAGMFNVMQGKIHYNLLPFERIFTAGGTTGTVQVDISEEGGRILGIKPGKRAVRYSGGPVVKFAAKHDPECSGKALGVFKSSVSKFGRPRGGLFNTPAIVYGTFGKGKVIATSFHPEYWESNHDIMLGCFYAVSGVKLTPVFPKKNRRPLRVGVFSTSALGHGPVKVMLDLERHEDVDVNYVMIADFSKGALNHLDVLVLPHGNELWSKRYLSPEARQKQLLQFMQRGGMVLASGNGSTAVPEHKNLKKLPENVDFIQHLDL